MYKATVHPWNVEDILQKISRVTVCTESFSSSIVVRPETLYSPNLTLAVIMSSRNVRKYCNKYQWLRWTQLARPWIWSLSADVWLSSARGSYAEAVEKTSMGFPFVKNRRQRAKAMLNADTAPNLATIEVYWPRTYRILWASREVRGLGPTAVCLPSLRVIWTSRWSP